MFVRENRVRFGISTSCIALIGFNRYIAGVFEIHLKNALVPAVFHRRLHGGRHRRGMERIDRRIKGIHGDRV